MNGAWLQRKAKKNLVVFCNGWGMDATPFMRLNDEVNDVYMLFNYQTLTPPEPISTLAAPYRRIHLVAWSMGVWAGQKLFAGDAGLFERRIAVNGTLCPIHDRFGIAEKNFRQTLSGFDQETRMTFYRRMCREKEILNPFLAAQPRRSIDDQRLELEAICAGADCTHADEAIYREILISRRDYIMPTANQENYWQGKTVVAVDAFHFPFYLWRNWEHLLAFADIALSA